MVVVALFCPRTNPCSSDGVGSVRLARQWIDGKNLVVNAGDGSHARVELKRRHVSVERLETAMTIPVIGRKEKELVAANRAAERPSELVIDQPRLCGEKLVASVQVLNIV